MDTSPRSPLRARALYRFLLRLYPARFRRAFEAELVETFAGGWADAAGAGARVRLWLLTLVDVLLSAPPEWIHAIRSGPLPTPDAQETHRMESLRQDIRYAFRALRQSPVFTLVAAITIGIGIGATTTVFSVANTVLIRPPAGVRAPGELLTVHAMSEDGSSFHSFSYPEYTGLRDAKSGLTDLAAFGIFPGSFRLEGEPEPRVILGMLATGNYFETLETRPALGRLFIPGDDRGAGGAEPVAVLSYETWQRRFEGDSGVIGRSVILNRQGFTVVGVTEPGFQGHITAMDVGVWVPLGVAPQLTGEQDLSQRNSNWLETVGRRRHDASRAQVREALAAAQAAGDRLDGRDPRGIDVRQYAPVPAPAIPFVGGFLGLLLVICGTVLLIASVNVGSILLSRAAARSREIAVRLAIGAGRARLIRQLLTESVVLFLLGGAAGIGITFVSTRLLESISLPIPVPMHLDFHPDLRVLAAALAVTLVTGLIFGLAPALQSTRMDLARAIREEGLSSRFHRSRLRNVLVTAQVAGSAVLLLVGGLFARALQQAGNLDLGFNPAGLYAAQVDLGVHHYTDPEMARFAEQVVAGLEARPGVSHAAATDALPLSMLRRTTMFSIPDREQQPNIGLIQSDFADVTPGYFATMGIPLVAGRDFSPADRADAPVVAIINQTMARQVWPGQDPVGIEIKLDDTPVRIVGVARNGKYASMGEEPGPFMYFPLAQQPGKELTIVARAAGSGPPLTGLIRDQIRQADADLPLLIGAPVAEIIGVSLLPNRIAALLAAVFGGIGLVLTGVGLYGLLAFAVNRRRREIGVRMALGAAPGEVRGLVLRDSFRLTAIGLGVGFALAFLATRFLRSFLFGVSPLDPLTFLAIAGLMAAVAFAASAVPAARATRTDPMESLRHE
ncbi:MAG: ABC transporter permease [Gemmatimonadales bacterium]